MEQQYFDGDFYVKYRWMIKELGLKGLELDIYAIVFGFSKDGIHKFDGSLAYLADWTGTTRAGVKKALDNLVVKKYLIKEDVQNGSHFKYCRYWAAKTRENLSNQRVKTPDTQVSSPKLPEISNENEEKKRTTELYAIQNTCKPSYTIPEEKRITELHAIQNTCKLSFENVQLSCTNNIYNKLAAASLTKIKNKIESLFGTFCFDDNFMQNFSDFINTNKIPEENLEDYIQYVFEVCERKKPKSITNLFFRLSCKNDVYSDYMVTKKQREEKELKNIKLKAEKRVCPHCGKSEFSVEERVYGVCNDCGFDFSEIWDEAIDKGHKAMELAVSLRAKEKQEIINQINNKGVSNYENF